MEPLFSELQQTICSNQFDYRIEVNNVPHQEAILIPSMLLQPFVENAILHGFNGQKEKGQINIRIQKDHKVLQCVVEDNGRGFQGVEAHYQKRPLSTIINKERLEILSRQTRTFAQLKIIDKKSNDRWGRRAGRAHPSLSTGSLIMRLPVHCLFFKNFPSGNSYYFTGTCFSNCIWCSL